MQQPVQIPTLFVNLGQQMLLATAIVKAVHQQDVTVFKPMQLELAKESSKIEGSLAYTLNKFSNNL